MNNKKNYLKDFLIYIGIALLPFQIFSIKIYSHYDLASIIILLFIFLFFLKIHNNFRFNIDKKYLIYLFLFLLVQIVLFIFNEASFLRLLSGLAWIGSLLFIYMVKDKLNLNYKLVKNILLHSAFLSSLMIIVQMLVLNYNRPPAFFSEPSYAGLFFYSISAACFAMTFFSINNSLLRKKIYFIFAIFFLIIAFTTKSMHFISLLIFYGTLFICSFFKKKIFSFKDLSISILFFVIIAFIFFTFGFQKHFLNNLSVFDISNASQSLLTWLLGLDQCIAALSKNPFTGLGLGSTGSFNFNSDYFNYLSKYSQTNNLTDAYAGFFRIVIEMGIIFGLCLIYLLVKSINNIFSDLFVFNDNLKNLDLLFVRIFSSTMFIGILLKEPTYSRSVFYVGIFLFILSSYHSKKNKSHTL